MKPTQAPPGSPRGAFSFVGRSVTIYGFCPLAARPQLHPRLIRKADAARTGQSAL